MPQESEEGICPYLGRSPLLRVSGGEISRPRVALALAVAQAIVATDNELKKIGDLTR